MSTTIEPGGSSGFRTTPHAARPRAAESPTPRQRAAALHDVYTNARDAHERLLAREMIAHYRDYCARKGIADPFS